MIIFDGDYGRIFRQLKDEKEKVLYYLEKNKPKARKAILGFKTIPAWYTDTITFPKTRNTYLLYYYCLRRSELNDVGFTGCPLILNDNKGRLIAINYRHMKVKGDGHDEVIWALQVYSGHFFSRYRERMGLSSSLSVNDVIATFFGRNAGYFYALDYNEIVLDKNKYKSNSAWAVDDGVLLSEEMDLGDFWVYKHNTFLSRNELKSDQMKATPERSELRHTALMYK